VLKPLQKILSPKLPTVEWPDFGLAIASDHITLAEVQRSSDQGYIFSRYSVARISEDHRLVDLAEAARSLVQEFDKRRPLVCASLPWPQAELSPQTATSEGDPAQDPTYRKQVLLQSGFGDLPGYRYAYIGTERAPGKYAWVAMRALEEVFAIYSEFLDMVDAKLLDLIPAPLALLRACEWQEHTFGLLDIGKKGIRILMVERGLPAMIRTYQGNGGEAMTKAIADHAHLPMLEAERWKRTHAVPGEDRPERRAAKEMAREWAEAVLDTAGGINMEKLYLAGGGALQPGLSNELARRLGLPVELVRPRPDLLFAIDLGPQFVRFAEVIGTALGNGNARCAWHLPQVADQEGELTNAGIRL